MLKMTKMIAVALGFLMVSSLGGCSQDKAQQEQKPTVPAEQVASEATQKAPEPVVLEAKPAVEAVEGAITFEDQQFGFIKVDSSPGNADLSELSIVDSLGSKALKVTIKDGKVPYVAIDAASLLGSKLPELRKMELSIMLESPSGVFYACSGAIFAYSGEDRVRSSDAWSVYLDHKNPNKAAAELTEGQEFVLDAKNFFVLTKETDNGAEPSHMIIDNIVFYDANGNVLVADSSAGFDAPAGFGAADLSNLSPVVGEQIIEGAVGSSSGWGQAVSIESAKNEGAFDVALLTEGSIITLYYQSASEPELIFQSWTDGAPDTSGWAKVTPFATNNSGTVSQFSLADIAAAFGTDDLVTYVDKFNVGDTGNDLTVTKITVGTPASEAFGWADFSNLEAQFASSVEIPEAVGKSSGWGQAVSLETVKNEGVFDASLLTPTSIVTVIYDSVAAPELILQSWTDGAPDNAGWAKVSPAAVNEPGNVCQFSYEDIVAAFGTEDFVTYLDKVNVGDTGEDLAVIKIVVSQKN